MRRILLVRLTLGCAAFLLGCLLPDEARPDESDAWQRYSDRSQLMLAVDAAGNEHSIRTPDAWQVRRRHILSGMQAAMGRLPLRDDLPPMAPEKLQELQGDGFLRLTIAFTVEPGHRLTADLYLPQSEPTEGATADPDSKRQPAMLALHPTSPLGKRVVADEGPRPNRGYAKELAQRGYVVLAPDYPSFGEQKHYDFEGDRYVSGTMKGIFNHMRCVDLLSKRDDVDADRIGVIGHSLGGHNAIFVGAFDTRLKAIVSSCGWTPFHHYYEGDLRGWTSDRYMPRIRATYRLDPDRVPFDFYGAVAALAPRAFFTNAPLHDGNFAVEGVRLAEQKLRPVWKLFEADDRLVFRHPDAGHDFPVPVRREAYRFVDRVLNHTPSRDVP